MAAESSSVNKGNTKDRAGKIRNAALELFSSKGYHNTSISEVARKAGVSKGLMYNYYESKEALLEAIVMGLTEESFAFAYQLEKLSSPFDKIRATLEYSLEAIEKSPEHARMMLALSLHGDTIGEVSKYTGKLTREFIGFFVAILAEAGVEEPELETYLLISSLDGLAIHYIFFMDDAGYPWQAIRGKFIKNTLKHLNL